MRILLCAAIPAALLLSACTVDDAATTAAAIPAAIKQVQKQTTQICAFVPTFNTVAQIFAKDSSLVAQAGSVAQSVCNALSMNVQAEGNVPGRYLPAIRVKGQLVVIKGSQVR
jgi:hypothetical protein